MPLSVWVISGELEGEVEKEQIKYSSGIFFTLPTASWTLEVDFKVQ